MFRSAVGEAHFNITDLEKLTRVCIRATNETDYLLSQFQRWVRRTCMLGEPGTEMTLSLIRINVFRALMINSSALGRDPRIAEEDDALSPFCVHPDRSASKISAMPSSLRPTEMQRQIFHHPWIDSLPFPGMRQNLMLAGDALDEWELCGDLVGLFSSGSGRTGMIVWGDPSEPKEWEVTEQFIEYWGWTVRGCWDLFESTNRWRERRGEKPICFDNFRISK